MDLERGEAETLEYGRVVFGDLWGTTHKLRPKRLVELLTKRCQKALLYFGKLFLFRERGKRSLLASYAYSFV